jgi:uncharacterized protein YqeY
MSIQQQIKQELVTAITQRNEPKKSALRFILGEFSRGHDKDLPDASAIKIIRKAIEDEKSVNGSPEFIATFLTYHGDPQRNHIVDTIQY